LDTELIRWGAKWNLEKALEATDAENKRDEIVMLRALGQIAKERAVSEPDWFFRVASERPRELLELATYIGQIVLYGQPFPPTPNGWVKWLTDCWRWPMRKR